MDDYRILLDEPAGRPALGFDQYARAFAAIILQSDPRFAVGIFGDWGSGKTTLMRAIERELQADETVVTLWFNAWRYEREEHLIVPLLDTLREVLKEWAERPDRDPDLRERARRAAATVSGAAGALLAGLSVTAGIPGGPSLVFDVDRAQADWRQREEAAAQQPRSLYHAVFRALQQSLARFVECGRQRIVVFIDDLDRCLPTSALQVLESMKLFFDLEGFVFVVGLDREVVQRAIELKYRPLEAAAGTVDSPVNGSEYIKKVFQLPFTLPPISVRQVDEFLASLADAGLPVEQREDLLKRVRPHLDHVITEAGVNPREVKRYLNSYTLQRKINPGLDADVVLGLQTLAFREGWRQAYEVLLAEREVFTDAVRRQLDGNPDAVENLWPELAAVPRSCFAYLGSLGMPLLQAPSLDPYLHSIESTESTHSGLVDAYRVVGDLRGLLRESAGAPAADRRRKLQSEFREQLPSLLSALNRLPGNAPATRLQADVETLVRRLDPSQLAGHLAGDAEGDRAALDSWQRSADELLVHIQTRLREVRQTVTVGPAA
jgi:KAP family P-loop domain